MEDYARLAGYATLMNGAVCCKIRGSYKKCAIFPAKISLKLGISLEETLSRIYDRRSRVNKRNHKIGEIFVVFLIVNLILNFVKQMQTYMLTK